MHAFKMIRRFAVHIPGNELDDLLPTLHQFIAVPGPSSPICRTEVEYASDLQPRFLEELASCRFRLDAFLLRSQGLLDLVCKARPGGASLGGRHARLRSR